MRDARSAAKSGPKCAILEIVWSHPEPVGQARQESYDRDPRAFRFLGRRASAVKTESKGGEERGCDAAYKLILIGDLLLGVGNGLMADIAIQSRFTK